jgi:hypothetical protein
MFQSPSADRNGPAPVTSVAKRFGVIAARIGRTFTHRVGIAMPLANGGFAAVGTIVHIDVKDITRHRAAAEHAKWVCRSPHCVGKRWNSKEELLEAHPENRILVKQEETHVYCAVVELEAVAAQPGKDGKPGRGEQPAIVMLLSDEE